MSFFPGGRADQQKGRNMGSVVLQKPSLPLGLKAAQTVRLGRALNAEGKISLYAKESPEYDHFTSHEDAGVKLLNAMRSKRS
ncbi:hypothetical protein NSS79_11990 [Paenibacillus sp. FSL L8-0436]|uniref:hypothetical protein n=1 Tax=Paenibacillus sp. FSL L8-0436 TaxID=2954686 RepID=UPI003159007D